MDYSSITLAALAVLGLLSACSAQSNTYNATWDFRNAKSKNDTIKQAGSSPYLLLFDPSVQPIMRATFAASVSNQQIFCYHFTVV